MQVAYQSAVRHYTPPNAVIVAIVWTFVALANSVCNGRQMGSLNFLPSAANEKPIAARCEEALARSLECINSENERNTSASAILMRSVEGDRQVLAAVVRGAVADQIPPESLRQVKSPVLILNGTADLANLSVRRLLEVIRGARSINCDGDHHTTPWQPSFQDNVVQFFQVSW